MPGRLETFTPATALKPILWRAGRECGDGQCSRPTLCDAHTGLNRSGPCCYRYAFDRLAHGLPDRHAFPGKRSDAVPFRHAIPENVTIWRATVPY
jgi:hypothetical protein